MRKDIVENVLIDMGMPVKLKGFRYITDAVMLLDTAEWQNPKWTALYYKIGLMNHDTASRVERAIRNAFVTTRNRAGNYEAVAHYIGFTNCENSNSLTYLYKTIKKEYPEPDLGGAEGEGFQNFNSVNAGMIREMVRQTLKEMFVELV